MRIRSQSTQAVIALAEKLISINSTKEHPDKIKEALECIRYELSDFRYDEFNKNGVVSALFSNMAKRQSKFTVLLNGHIDVVPGNESQFKPYSKNDRLYGRGAIDMKSAVASMVHVFQSIAKSVSYPLALQIVSDEEIGGFRGTKYQLERGIYADFVIGGEPTDLAVSTEAKGVLLVKVIAKGQTGHGAYLWKGKNAVWLMKKFLDKLEEFYPEPVKEIWKTTINVANIVTPNETLNKVPDICEVNLDIRYLPGDENTVEKNLKKCLFPNITLQILEKESAHIVDEKNKYLHLLEDAIEKVTGSKAKKIRKHAASDMRHFSKFGHAGVLLGPIGEGQHSDVEWIDVASLGTYHQVLEEFLMSLNK